MKKVAILMATYNGETYLKEQLDSIREQTYENWELWIQDDGSSDQTKTIIQDYQKIDNRIHLVENETDYHGAFLNFFTLIQRAKETIEADYYCLADQDDIWNNDKLAYLVEYANIRYGKELFMLYTDASLIDSDGCEISDSFDSEIDLKLPSPYQMFLGYNTFVYGCTTMFNKALLDSIPIYDLSLDIIIPHDKYLSQFALSYGKLDFIDKPLMKYRRHEKNVSVMPRKTINYNVAKVGLSTLAKKYANNYNQFLVFQGAMRKADKLKSQLNLEQLEKMIRNGGLSACYFLIKNKVYSKSLMRTLVLYAIIFSKNYKRYLKF